MSAVDLDNIRLAFGSHASREEGMCLLEAVAYVAGEPHTDRPQCACPILATFGRSWNDGLSDEDRNRLLRPFIARLVGTRSTPEVEQRRAYMATDWAVRTCAPVWLRAAGLEDAAGSLEALAPLTSVGACRDAMPTIRQARETAFAAGAAAGDVGVYAAWDAARSSAVYAAARAAARGAAVAAAVDLAVDLAVDAAAGAATGAAGVAAARTALLPYVEQLQASAVRLFEQMIEVAA